MDKNSKVSDAIGNLYRAALYLAKDSYDNNKGLKFAKKAVQIFNLTNNYKNSAKKIDKYLNNYSANQKDQALILAEKILDQYLFLK